MTWAHSAVCHARTRRRERCDGRGMRVVMKNTVTAIDFGTSKIVALVAETSGRQRCDIIGAGFSAYSGFADGQWNEPNALNEAISNAVH